MNKKLINIVKGDIKSAIKQGNYNREVNRHSNIEFDTESKQILLDGVAYSNPSMVTLTYNKLYTLREDNELIPGVFYKITDVTNAIKPGSEYEDYQFDVIVLALSTNTLSEDAYAMLHGDQSEDVNQSKWKVKYTLDNDKSKFSWANNTVDNSTYGTITSNDYSSEPVTFEFNGTTEYLDPYSYFGWEDGQGNIVFTRSYEVHVGDTLYRNGDLIPVATIASIEYVHQGTGLPNGRGIIYDIIESEKKNNSLIEVTWQQLKDLRDNSQLIPGFLYRITDYNCTTTQENTQSAGHQFDIVLLALSENKLAEEGWAMMHENIYDVTFADGVTKKCYIYCTSVEDDFWNVVEVATMLGWDEVQGIEINEGTKTAIVGVEYGEGGYAENLTYNYFQNSNLSAWKVWYCLDNDKSRFAWADDSVDEGSPAKIQTNGSRGYTFPTDTTFIRNEQYDEIEKESGKTFYAWVKDDDNSTIAYTSSNHPHERDEYLYVKLPRNFVQANGNTVDGYTPAHEGTNLPNGRGVIYRLIDEWNNDCPYDFKNIQFKRKLTDGQYDPTNATDTWVYTFNAILGVTQSDNSLGLNLALAGGSGMITLCAENVIKPFYDYGNQQSVLGGQGKIVLNKNVFLCNASSLKEIQKLFVYANKFDVNSMGNTFKDMTAENIFGADCKDNTFGDNCTSNVVGNLFQDNTIKHGFSENVVGNHVHDCQFNWWCADNMFGNYISNCVFGNPGGVVNSSDSGFYNSTIGNGCSYLSLIGDVGNFTIGNGVYSFYTTAITTNNVIVENGVSYVTLDCPSSDNYTKRCTNITIAQGVSGTSSAQKVITHPTVGDTFQTIYKPTNSQVVSV